jgi:hypothetical protein
MSPMTYSRMVISESEGWREVCNVKPSATRMFLSLVIPLSLLPPLMYAYTELTNPGRVFKLIEPPLASGELALIGGLFFLIEIATVFLMAAYIRELGNVADVHPDFATAYAMAAIAPTPLWLSSLGLLMPSMWFNLFVGVMAWLASAALIRHGVRPLFGITDLRKAHRLANLITAAGVGTWLGMLLVMMMLLGMVLGWR